MIFPGGGRAHAGFTGSVDALRSRALAAGRRADQRIGTLTWKSHSMTGPKRHRFHFGEVSEVSRLRGNWVD